MARQAALAQALLTDGQTELAIARTAPAPAGKGGREENAQAQAQSSAETGGGQARRSGAAQAAEKESEGAAATLEALAQTERQGARLAVLRQQAIERESTQIMERLGVKLSERTPQTQGDGLLGGYETAMTVAGVASLPTMRSMEEISRFFERDARRYGA